MRGKKRTGWIIEGMYEANDSWHIKDKNEVQDEWINTNKYISEAGLGKSPWIINRGDEEQGSWLIDNKNDEPGRLWVIQYWEIVENILESFHAGNDPDEEKKWSAINRIRKILHECNMDENLDYLTDKYKWEKANNPLGYDTQAIIVFINEMEHKYPKPKRKKKNRPAKHKIDEALGILYWKIAQKMDEAILTIRDPIISDETKMMAANRLREQLQICIQDKNLDDLTSIYRDKKADNILGYDTQAIEEFVKMMLVKYPKH